MKFILIFMECMECLIGENEIKRSVVSSTLIRTGRRRRRELLVFEMYCELEAISSRLIQTNNEVVLVIFSPTRKFNVGYTYIPTLVHLGYYDDIEFKKIHNEKKVHKV